ncbi:MAG: PAS domain S-box protein [Gammaproteobacteria bacterium]|nr:PAS domain S-box protein [Gammaproteobacteria bacterium]
MTTPPDNAASLAEARFAALLDAAVDAILVISDSGRIETFNRAAEALFGYSADEIRGKNVSVLMPEPYRSEHDGYIKRYLETGEKKIIGIGREASARQKNGDFFPIDLSVGEIRHAGERRFVGIIRDISERKENARMIRQQQERLEHVMRLGTLGEMAAGIAHEINQPLTAISTYAQAAKRLINSGQLDDERLLEILDKTGTQAERAGQVIRRIRNLARKRPAKRERHDIHTVVEEVIHLAEVDTHLHNVSLEQHLPGSLPLAWIDPVQIQQVVLNLIRNAIETSPGANHVVVSAYKRNKEEVVIDVSDDGPGIQPDLLSEIFNPFFTTKEQGTGMGLSISRSIVTSHGGRLEARNNETGGATFSVVLPTAVSKKND